jgi:sec-independent protein translocase protein TatA
MFEGLFQPTHLLVIFGIALLVFDPKKLPELGKGIGEGIRGLKSAMKEQGREAGQRQTHQHGRPKLTDEAKTNFRSARDISGADRTKNLFSKRFKR